MAKAADLARLDTRSVHSVPAIAADALALLEQELCGRAHVLLVAAVDFTSSEAFAGTSRNSSNRSQTLDLCPAHVAPPRLPLSFLRGWAAAHERFVLGSKNQCKSANRWGPALDEVRLCQPFRR